MQSLEIKFFNREKQQQKPVPNTQETMNKCLCTECPTAPNRKSAYCAKGASKKPIEQVCALGCDCVFCSVRHEYNLSGCYLCLNKQANTK